MTKEATVFLWSESGEIQRWRSSEISKMGFHEKFLRDIIAKHPALLGLESLGSEIRGPFVTFTEVYIDRRQGGPVRADIILLSASGHVAIVEVKLASNAKFVDRDVIAQVVGYSTSLKRYKMEDLVSLFKKPFDKPAPMANSWFELVHELFPDAKDARELADALLHRFDTGEVQIVIACDIAPNGLREDIENILAQKALSLYKLRVLELRPYISGNKHDEILFLQNATIETEILGRTALTFTIQGNALESGVGVEVTVKEDSPIVVEKAIEKVRHSGGGQRRRATIITEVTALLTTAVEELIREHRFSMPDYWKGINVGNFVLTEKAGVFHIVFRFFDLLGDNIPENLRGRIAIDFKCRGNKLREQRLVELMQMVVDVSGPLDEMIGAKTQIVESDIGPRLVLPATVIPQPWTPETLAEWIAQVYRLFASNMPLRAWKPVSKTVPEEVDQEEIEDEETDESKF